MKSLEPHKNYKNQPRPLVRPSSVNFCQNFWNLSHETVPLNTCTTSLSLLALTLKLRRNIFVDFAQIDFPRIFTWILSQISSLQHIDFTENMHRFFIKQTSHYFLSILQTKPSFYPLFAWSQLDISAILDSVTAVSEGYQLNYCLILKLLSGPSF
jgi:hypothetical protein